MGFYFEQRDSSCCFGLGLLANLDVALILILFH